MAVSAGTVGWISRATRIGTSPASRVVYWIVLAAVVLAIHGAHVLDADEGVVLEGAWALLNGRRLYVDSFQFIAPGAFYALYWAWDLFGEHYIVAKALGLTAVLATAVAVFRIASLVDDSAMRYAGPLLYVLASAKWPAINHNAFNTACLAWALLLGMRSVRGPSALEAGWAGLLTGCGVLFVQHKGLAFGTAVCAFYAFRWLLGKEHGYRSLLLCYVACAVIPLLLLLKWPLSLLYEHLIRFPAAHYMSVNRVSYAPLLVAAGYLTLVARCPLVRTKDMQLLLCVQAALLLSAMQRTDISHVLMVSFPLYAVFPVSFALFMDRSSATRAIRDVYCGAALAAVVFGMSAGLLALFSWWQAAYDARLLAYIRAQCPTVYAGPFLPGIYYETRKMNVTSFPYLITGFNTREQFAAARSQLEASPPECVVTAYEPVDRFGYSTANAVDDYIAERYSRVNNTSPPYSHVWFRKERSLSPESVVAQAEERE